MGSCLSKQKKKLAIKRRKETNKGKESPDDSDPHDPLAISFDLVDGYPNNGWQPYMSTAAFDQVNQVRQKISRKKLPLPMGNYMHKQLYRLHPETKEVFRLIESPIIFSQKRFSAVLEGYKENRDSTSVSQSRGKRKPSDFSDDVNEENFATQHCVYFWRTIDCMCRHRTSPMKNKMLLMELFTHHQRLLDKTNTPTAEHMRTFLRAMDEFLVDNIDIYPGCRDDFQDFLRGLYFYMTKNHPDAPSWVTKE